MQRPLHSNAIFRACSLVAFTLFVGSVVGCGGGNTPKTEVKGKVLLGDKPVAGTVVFVSNDGKEVAAPIMPDGTYTATNAEVGSVKIYIKPGALGAPTVGAPKSAPGTPEMPKDMGGTSSGVPAPAKYTKVETSGLTYDVKSGKQEHNITLQP